MYVVEKGCPKRYLSVGKPAAFERLGIRCEQLWKKTNTKKNRLVCTCIICPHLRKITMKVITSPIRMMSGLLRDS